jgi:ribosomal protein L11 methylase PrmA
MPWHQLTVTTTEKSAPKVANYFTHLGAVSVTYLDAQDEPVYEPRIGETKIWTNTQVVALYELEARLIKSFSITHSTIGSMSILTIKYGSVHGWNFIIL